jgi:hypothetical protein
VQCSAVQCSAVQCSAVQSYGFSPVWVRRWAFRWEDLVYTCRQQTCHVAGMEMEP